MATRTAPPPDIAARLLLDLLRDIVARGRKPVETPDISDAAAIHDLRKALKNWRAMMRLIAPVIGDDAEAKRVEARDIARTIAAARDGQAAQEAFSDLLDSSSRRDIPGLPARSRVAITDRLAALRTEAEAVILTPAYRDHIAGMWIRAAAAIERWPLTHFDHRQAARQLAASYRQVCKAIPDEWSQAKADALHRLRQRVVEHRYQMELAEAVWPRLMRVWVSEAQRLRDRLGAHHDLAILQHLTEAGQPLARWHSLLSPPIAARQKAHTAAARRIAARLFAETPKAFLRRMTVLWELQAERSD